MQLNNGEEYLTFWDPQFPLCEVLFDVFHCFNLFHSQLQSDETRQSVFIFEQGNSVLGYSLPMFFFSFKYIHTIKLCI